VTAPQEISQISGFNPLHWVGLTACLVAGCGGAEDSGKVSLDGRRNPPKVEVESFLIVGEQRWLRLAEEVEVWIVPVEGNGVRKIVSGAGARGHFGGHRRVTSPAVEGQRSMG
jgi:hypothetical protein